jgi:hypothetical protein
MLKSEIRRVGMARGRGQVIIMGGGVAGLSAAHELRRRGYTGKILLFESLGAIGGVARSSSVPGTGTSRTEALPTEYSWRGLGSQYTTMHTLLREIPLWRIPTEAAPSDDSGRPDLVVQGYPCPQSGTVNNRLVSYDHRFLVPGPRNLQIVGGSFASYLLSPEIPLFGRVRLVDRVLVALTASRARIHSDYTRVSLQDFLGIRPDRDRELHDAVIRIVTPALGPDCYRVATSSICEYVEDGSRPNQPFHMMVFDAPTSEAWFQHWHRHLARTLNVDIRVRHQVRAILDTTPSAGKNNVDIKSNVDGENNVDDESNTDSESKVDIASKVGSSVGGEITGILVADAKNVVHRWVADAYINALPPHISARVLPVNSSERVSMTALAKCGLVYLPGIQFFFDEPLAQASFPAGVFSVHTPWLLTIEPQASTWRLDPRGIAASCFFGASAPSSSRTSGKLFGTELNADAAADRDRLGRWPHTRVAQVYGNGVVKDVWSVTLCDNDRVGVHAASGRRWDECTEDQVVAEVWSQLVADTSFSNTVRGAVSGRSMSAIRFVGAHVWQSFVRRDADGVGRMQRGIEPMVSSNAGSWQHRPRTQSRAHPNMMWASAYVQNQKEIVRMDLAVQAGIMAAEGVLKLVPTEDRNVNVAAAPRDFVASWDADTDRGPPRLFPWLCAPLRLLDRTFWSCGLSHPADLCGGSGIAFIFLTSILLVYLLTRQFA